jgi:hypothetical protein
MVPINRLRLLIGSLGGTIIWLAWSMVVNAGILERHYKVAQGNGTLLAVMRYPLFFFAWLVVLFLMSYVLGWLYANLRATRGPGPATALKLGLMFGFAAGVPLSLTLAAWSPMDRVIPLWWCLDMWVGSCLSVIVSGWLYKDPKPRAA